MWVPWKPGNTAREQRLIQERRARKRGSGGIKSGKQARADAIKARRKELLKQARKKKITAAEYRQAIRKLR